MFATPALMIDMIEKSKQHNLKVTTMTYALYGGAPCPQHLALELKETLNITYLMVNMNMFSLKI